MKTNDTNLKVDPLNHMVLMVYQILLESMYQKIACAHVFLVSAFGVKNQK